MPLGIAIMRDVLPPGRLGTAVALMSATMGVGGSLGMPVSAFIVEHFDWHALFWVSSGLGVVAFLLVFLIVPQSTLRSLGRFDAIGMIGLTVGLSGILLAVSRGAEWGWLSPATLLSGLGGIAVLLVWGRYQLRTREPLIDLRVAARPAVLFTNLASICMGFALFGSNVLLPQMLELPVESGAGFGLGVFETALLVIPAGLIMMIISPLSGWLERTVGPRIMLSAGTAAVTVSYIVLLIWSSSIWHLFIANLIVGVGIGLSFAAMPMMIMRSVPAEETGVSNGINALARSLGTSSASTVMAAVLAAMAVDLDGRSMPHARGVRHLLLDRRDRRRRGRDPVTADPPRALAGGSPLHARPHLTPPHATTLHFWHMSGWAHHRRCAGRSEELPARWVGRGARRQARTKR